MELAYAVMQGDVKLARQIVEGAPRPSRRQMGEALLCACTEGNIEIAHMLLQAGADIDYCENRELSSWPLRQALGREHDGPIVAFILKAGAAVDFVPPRVRDRRTAIYFARDPATIEMLVGTGARLDHHDHLGQTPLIHATVSLDPERVQAFIRAGSEVDGPDSWGNTPLAYGILIGVVVPADIEKRDRIVSILRDAGATPDGLRQASLVRAATDGDLRRVDELLSAGVDVNGVGPFGSQALMRAIAGGDVRTVRRLVAAGANVNAAEPDGLTPLMVAARGPSGVCGQGDLDLVSVLIDSGADVSASQDTGDGRHVDAAWYAREYRNAGIVAYLKERSQR